MHLVIHDASLRKVAFVDNTKQNTLKYIKYEWYRSLETAGSTFAVTIQKRAIQTDNHYEVAYNHLNERSFITFKAKNKTHLFSVMVVTENEETITCECESANLELINEYANPYKATKAMTFVEYCNAMDLLIFTYLTIGLNEVSDKKLTLEWESQDTKLARLLSIANKFDAEIEFDTRLNADSSIKQFILNVYHKNDDTHQGVGRIREDVQLVYGKNVKSVTRTIDKTGVYNAVRVTGKNENGDIVTIAGLSNWEEKNDKGQVEFYQRGEMLYAPLSMQLYPSTFTLDTITDQWTRKDITVDSDNPTVIRAEGIKALKRIAYPSITYEVDGFFDGEIGDTVKVIDNGFVPKLILKARVIEQYIYDDETKNKTVLGNFTALENRISDDIQARLNELVEKAKPYTVKLSTDNGVVFKNNIGQSIVTPTLYKGGKPVTADVTWRWALDGNVTTGMTYTVLGSNVTNTATLTVSAYVGNDEVAVDEISFVNVLDGTKGTPGTPGKDGRTPYVHTAWANNATGTSGFSLDNSIDKLYIGIYTDFEPADSTDPTKYKWTLIKGEKGDKGTDGVPGKDGVGIKSTVITYGLSASDSTQPSTWTTTVPNLVKGQYLWTKNIWTYTDNTNETGYTKTYIAKDGNNGADGIAGKDGVGIKTTTITYAKSTNGTTAPTSGWTTSVPIAVAGDFLWTKTVWVYTDNTNETGYSVARMGLNGAKGADGKTSYTHVAYANSADGRSAFSTSDSNRTYIGVYVDQVSTDSADPTRYKWTIVKGADGAQGIPGTNGADGRTPYLHIAYANNSSGTAGFSTTDSTGKTYIGQYTDYAAADSTNPASYKWALIQGPKGDQGTAGANAYFFVAYADSPNGSSGFSLTDTSKRYMGHYSSNSPTQSQSYASYKWVDRANVTATFVQSTAPTNPPTGSRWKYTGSTVITANSSTISPGEQYLFIGDRWVKDVITSDNLQIKDQFINGPMIKDNAVTVDKLSVGSLSAITANLGSVNAGKMLLQRSFSAGSSAVPAYSYPAFKTGLFVDNYGLIVNGSPVQKFTTEATASDMPVVSVTSGEVRFMRANLTDNIEEVLHNGLSDPDFGYIQFGRDGSGRNALIIEANGQVYLKGENYTSWLQLPNGVMYKIAGDLVTVDFNVTPSSSRDYIVATLKKELMPKTTKMFSRPAWTGEMTRIQVNTDGNVTIIGAVSGRKYSSQVSWTI